MAAHWQRQTVKDAQSYIPGVQLLCLFQGNLELQTRIHSHSFQRLIKSCQYRAWPCLFHAAFIHDMRHHLCEFEPQQLHIGAYRVEFDDTCWRPLKFATFSDWSAATHGLTNQHRMYWKSAWCDDFRCHWVSMQDPSKVNRTAPLSPCFRSSVGMFSPYPDAMLLKNSCKDCMVLCCWLHSAAWKG